MNAQRLVPPRSTEVASIPGLLRTLQTQWDAQMLETFTLKKQLHAAREELTHSLYQNDAACRVIARLIKERDQARREVEQLRQGGAGYAVELGQALAHGTGRDAWTWKICCLVSTPRRTRR